MARFYYSNSIKDFIADDNMRIFGCLTSSHPFESLTPELKASWRSQISILKLQLRDFEDGHLYFEFSIPRMGKRVDAILIYRNLIFVIEFKVGSVGYEKHAVDQVVDYTVDLKNFHEGSHHACLIPILIATEAEPHDNSLVRHSDSTFSPLFANSTNLRDVIELCKDIEVENPLSLSDWETSTYRPTPTIVEAAQALYSGHTVEEISRTDSNDVSNLTITSDRIQSIIDESFSSNVKSICFVTGVPGAGKTLAGLNIAIRNMEAGRRHATYMSGNGPLVQVLREALSRNRQEINKLHIAAANDPENHNLTPETRITLAKAQSWASTIIQAIHEFRADQMDVKAAPPERVVIFDESQRAWTKEKLRSYLGAAAAMEFDVSEPQFLIGEMDRHDGFSTIVCLVGGGQEIHDGEAGIEEWFQSLRNYFPDWQIHFSDRIINSEEYVRSEEIRSWLLTNGQISSELHLDMPIRSFRSDKVANFVETILDENSSIEQASLLCEELRRSQYPIRITRNLDSAKEWLRKQARGTNRIGLVASSGGIRLKPLGIFVKNKIKASDWFLKGKDDVRSSYYLEDVATEFDIQGLELDWVGVCWDGDFHHYDGNWNLQQFSGSVWKGIDKDTERRYLRNKYRVLLTRARQGMVIFVPPGDTRDDTRPPRFYDGTFQYLRSIGIEEI